MNRSSRTDGRKKGTEPRGQSLTEFVVMLPLLLFVVIGVIEFGNAIGITHTITGYTREGANLAARGTPLDTVLKVIGEQGTSIDLASRGGVIASRIQIEQGDPVIREQVASPGYSGASRIGVTDSTSASLSGLGLVEDQSYWVVEVFYEYEPIGPFDAAFQVVGPGQLYRRTLF